MEKKAFLQLVQGMAATYRANPAVVKQLAQVDLIAIVGPTGVGKTTIIERLGIPYVVSDVTRPMREGEKDGQEYHFRTDYFAMLQEIKRGEYAQYLVAINNEFYGSRASGYPESGAAAMAVIAKAIPHFRTLGFRKVIPIYILPPSYVEWLRRIGAGRSLDISARMAEARESLPMALKDPEYRFVLNDDIELALEEVKTIIAGGVVTEHRQKLARESADLLFGRLGVDDELLGA